MRQQRHSLREFEVLRALIVTGTATAAAARIGISQSAVSRAVAQLEARIGHALFERRNGRLTATAEALALNENLSPLFETLSRIDNRKWTARANEPLRLVAPPTIAHHFLHARIASFIKLHPSQHISCEITTGDVLLNTIADGHNDVGFADLGTEHAGVRFEPFARVPAAVALPKGHRLAKRDTIALKDLQGERYVALTRRHRRRALIESRLAAAGVMVEIVAETDTSVALLELVRRGVGFAIVNPFPVAGAFADDVVLRRLDPGFIYETCAIRSAVTPLRANARAFIRHIRMTVGPVPFSQPGPSTLRGRASRDALSS